MTATEIRNMQIPAYSPVLCGVKEFDQRGVDVETKKVIAIESAPIIVVPEVDVDVDIDMISVVVADVVIVIDISVLNRMAVAQCWRREKIRWRGMSNRCSS